MLWILALLPALYAGESSPAALAERISAAGLNPGECYRVRDLFLGKEDIRIYFTEGFIIFGNEVDGRRRSAVFSGDIDGGDGEVIVMPPHRSERLSLATFTESPNLNEHFSLALMIFSDSTAEALERAVQAQPRIRKSPERGALLADQWNSTVSNLSRSFGTRLVYDAMANRPPEAGFFYAAIQGNRRGNFDVVYDPTAPEQVQVGQVKFRDNRPFFNVWTSFVSRSFRNGAREPFRSGYQLSDYVIDATLDRNLSLTASTRTKLTVTGEPVGVMFFDVSPQVKITGVEVNGQPAEVWQRDSLRANLFGGRSGLFLVAAPQPLAAGVHEIRFEHDGNVVRQAGNGVYFVGARAHWYPSHGSDFAHFDITFRYPRGINLVFTGEVLEENSGEEWQVTRRRTRNPIRLAGFNVGEYKHIRKEEDGFAIEVYANTRVEDALRPQRRVVMMPRRDLSNPRRRGQLPELAPVTTEVPPPDPSARLEEFAEEVARAFRFMAEHFGPPPTDTLMVSPIPGAFGQGFPGLLYLSTMSYLAPEDRPEAVRSAYQEYFFSAILHAHETAHQWWGNTVTTTNYQDTWLMEALANYSALMLLEEHRGPEALQAVLDQYRTHLLTPNADGDTLESAGPISWGPRLDSSRATAFRVITYEKGSWIIHMLRRRLGDEAFLKMLGDLCRNFRFQSITTDDFRRHAAAYLPAGLQDRNLEYFFDQWVFDIGIPELRCEHRVRGNPPRVRVTGSIRQSGVPEYFSALVPVEIRLPGGEVIHRWLQTSEEPATFDFTLPEKPEAVVFNPGEGVLCIRK